MPRTARGLLLAAVTAAGLLGCGSSTPPTGQQAAIAPPTASPTAGPSVVVATMPKAYLGTWTAPVKGTSASGGSWTLRITDHDVELKNPIATSDSEFFSINPDVATDATLHLAKDPDCDQADYAWSIVEAHLVLTTAADSCTDRKEVLASAPWTRQP